MNNKRKAENRDVYEKNSTQNMGVRAVKWKDWGIIEVSVKQHLTESNLFLLGNVLSIRYNIQLLP